jgi:hypothetical protein
MQRSGGRTGPGGIGTQAMPDEDLRVRRMAGLREALYALPATHRAAFAAVVEAIVLGTSGVFVAGPPGPGRSDFLKGLLGIMPADQVAAMRIEPDASPDAFAFVLQGVERDSVWRTARVLIVIEDADLLRRDTLDLVNQAASSLLADEEGPQLLLLGRLSFEKRLVVNGYEALAAYLQTTLTLDASVPAETRAPGPGPSPSSGIVTSAPLAPLYGTQERGRIVFWGAAGIMLAAIGVVSSLTVPLWLQDEPTRPSAQASLTPLDARPATLLAFPPSPSAQPSPAQPAPGQPATISSAPTAPTKPEIAGARPDKPLARAFQAGQARPSGPSQPPAAGRPQAGGPGLLLVARSGDTLATLYQSVYAGVTPPPFADIAAANSGPFRPGKRLIFPTPAGGWQSTPGRPVSTSEDPYAASETSAGAAPP